MRWTDPNSWRVTEAEKELEADDLSVEIQRAYLALQDLAAQAEGAGARRLHHRVLFWITDLRRAERRLADRTPSG